MAAALRDRDLKKSPSRAAIIAEFVVQEAEQGRANIKALCFNCGSPEDCTLALEAIPNGLRQRLRDAKISLGVYPNLNQDSEKRQSAGFALSNADSNQPIKKTARREDVNVVVLK